MAFAVYALSPLFKFFSYAVAGINQMHFVGKRLSLAPEMRLLVVQLVYSILLLDLIPSLGIF